MNSVFVISRRGGWESDAWSEVACVVATEAKAIETCAKLKATYIAAKEAYSTLSGIYGTARSEFKKNNQLPFPKLPKNLAPENTELGSEQRLKHAAELEKVRKHNDDIYSQSLKVGYDEVYKVAKWAMQLDKDVLDILGLSEPNKSVWNDAWWIHSYNLDVTYDEVPFL